jgi:hypothetical protein
MRELIHYYWLMYRANYHWNRMIAKQERTGFLHNTLYSIDRRYARHSNCYNDCINELVDAADYVTALSIVRSKANGSTAEAN